MTLEAALGAMLGAGVGITYAGPMLGTAPGAEPDTLLGTTLCMASGTVLVAGVGIASGAGLDADFSSSFPS